MRKIFSILVLTIVLSVIRINRVMAETFYEDNWISGVYVNLIDGDFSKPQQMRFIKRRSDNRAIYCLTPRETIYETENYNKYNAGDLNVINMSVEKYLRLSEIAYFGYGYPNHTSDEWYAITQFMLWREMEPNMDIFFTDKFKGNRINRFENEINEIENLITNFKKIPNFGELNLLPNSEYQIEDKNNVLNTYNIYSSDIPISKNGNILTINTKNTGTYNFSFLKIPNLYNDTSFIYKAQKGQDLLVAGAISSIHAGYKINVSKGKININKKDSRTNENIKGAKYNLYDNNDILLSTLSTDQNGNISFDNLIYGNYKIKEQEAPIGYTIDDNIYEINLNAEVINIPLYDNKIKSSVNITKKLSDKDVYEEGIQFNIYDEKDEFIDQIVTDQNGKTSVNLLYGKYKFVQQNTTLGYKKVDDFYVNIENGNDINIFLEDERIVANLKVIKKDMDFNTPITLSNTKFKIYDLINEEYLFNNDSEIFETVNGEINLVIKGGKYLLEEIESPNGYIKGDNIMFEVDENTILENNTLIINFYNRKELLKLYEPKSFNKKSMQDKFDKADDLKKELSIDNNDIKEKNSNNTISNDTIYPKTSNVDILVNTLISYILFLGIVFLLSGLKHEK